MKISGDMRASQSNLAWIIRNPLKVRKQLWQDDGPSDDDGRSYSHSANLQLWEFMEKGFLPVLENKF
jgi:hypothetical protein